MTRLYDRNFAVALICQTCFVLANTLMAHYARWVEFLSGDVRDVGWIMGIAPVAGLLARPWIGQWIDRIGSRAMWGIGEVLFIATLLANLLLVDVGWPIYVLRLTGLVAVALAFASSLTYITHVTPPERRTEAIGVFGCGGFIGMLIGPYMGDLFLGTGERSRGDFALLFGAAAGSVAISLVLLFFVRPVPPTSNGRRARAMDFFHVVGAHWPGMVLLVCVTFGVSMTLPFVFLADFVDKMGLGGIGTFFFAYAGWGLFLRFGLRRVPDRIGRRKVLLVGLGFLSAGAFSFLLVQPGNILTLLIPGFLCGTGHSLVFHTMAALALEPFSDEYRGVGSALTLMHLDLGLIGGAPILGLIAYYRGYDWVFITVGTIALIVGALFAWSSVPIWRARRQQAAAQVGAPCPNR